MRNHTSWFMQIEKTVWKSLFLTGHTIIYFILWILMSVFLICWFINLENLETVLLSFNIHLASVWLFLKMITHVTFKFLFLLYRCHTGYIDMVFLWCESTCHEKHSIYRYCNLKKRKMLQICHITGIYMISYQWAYLYNL